MRVRLIVFGVIRAAALCCLLPAATACAQALDEKSHSQPAEREPVEALWPNTNIEFLKIGPNDTSDELWARALWISLPPYDAESEEIAGLFIAAIDRAKEKAPLYVSFGRTDSGPSHFKQRLAGVEATFREQVATEIAKELEKQNPSELQKQIAAGDPAAEKRLVKLFQQANAKARTSEAFAREIEAIAKTMNEGTSAAERYYVAAIVEDPAYLPARFFLAKESEGKLHEEAVAGLIRHDPDNALGYYLQAAIALEKNDLAATLKLVEKGNIAKTYRLYDSPLPQKFTLRYPQRDDLQTLGVAGQPMSVEALHTLVRGIEEARSWTDSIPKKIRHLVRSFEEEAKRHKDAGEIDKALPWLLATRGMAWRLLRVDSAGWSAVGTIIQGCHFESVTYVELKSLYESRKDGRLLAALEEEHGRVLEFRHDLDDAIDRKDPTGDAVAAGILRGQYDPFAKRSAQILQARRKVGIVK